MFKHMRLLKYKVAIAHGARTGTVRKAWAAAKIDEQWKENALYKSIVARRTRASLNDFERFKLSKAKKARNQYLTNFTVLHFVHLPIQKPRIHLHYIPNNKKVNSMRNRTSNQTPTPM